MFEASKKAKQFMGALAGNGQQAHVRRSCWKVILLKDHNVVHYESNRQSKWRCWLMGIIWKYMPDLTFNGRDYMIVDA